MTFDRALGERVVDAIDESGDDIRVGDQSNETLTEMNKGIDPEFAAAIRESSIQFWGSVGPVFTANQSNVEEFRQLRVYDGTPKRSDLSQNHVDHFIPEERFHTPSSPPETDFTEFERNKEDVSLVPEFTKPDTLDNVRDGYRVIITDDVVNADSIIRPIIMALDRNEENDLPDGYDHVSPGSIYILNQRSGEFQIFFEQKGAYFIKYGVWNNERNVDSEPVPVPLA